MCGNDKRGLKWMTGSQAGVASVGQDKRQIFGIRLGVGKGGKAGWWRHPHRSQGGREQSVSLSFLRSPSAKVGATGNEPRLSQALGVLPISLASCSLLREPPHSHSAFYSGLATPQHCPAPHIPNYACSLECWFLGMLMVS